MKTTDKATAIKRAIVQNEAIEKFWRDVMKYPATEEQKDNLYQQSVQSARVHGFIYRDISDLSENASSAELVDRLLALKTAEERQPERSAELGAAIIGTVEPPKITLSETWDIYRPKCGDRLIGKTEHQVRICHEGIYFQNLEETISFRPIREIATIQNTPVGNLLPFRDINYVVLGMQKTEDPNDGYGIIHALMCYHGMNSLAKAGVPNSDMKSDVADGMKIMFDKIICHGKDKKSYKKELHTFLTQQESKIFS